MLKHDLVRVKHMRDGAEEIQKFIQGKTKNDLEHDRMLSLAIVQLLEIIGEAANKVTPEFCAKYTQIPWKSVVGMRNRLIHGYFDIDLNIVWKTAVDEIPSLNKALTEIIKTEEFADGETAE